MAMMKITFEIDNGEVTYDVLNGDGVGCEALVKIMTQDLGEVELVHKPEYDNGVTVTSGRRTA